MLFLAVVFARTLKGFEIRVLGESPRAGAFAGFSAKRMTIFAFAVSGALAGLAGIMEVASVIGKLQPTISPGYGFTAIIVAFLGRLNPLGILVAGFVIALTYLGGEAIQSGLQVSAPDGAGAAGDAALLRARLQFVHPLPGAACANADARRGPSPMLEAFILTVITAATPLFLAAIGELVVERAGVLNLGVEGMMVMGAVGGFAVTITTGSPTLGICAGMAAGAAISLIFAFVTQTLAANQVASGLALTLFGLGLSGLLGEGFVGMPGIKLASLDIPGLTDLPYVGKILFGQDILVYLSFALAAAVSWLLFRTRVGLVLRAVGENHTSAHALGYNVIGVRYLAILFGGACAGLGGAYLSVAYTPLWVENMTAGRGWIALALVVFASWLPGRVVIGAYLFGAVSILQLHAQMLGLGVPSQFLSMLPYVVTVLVLVIISSNRRAIRLNTPACLGRPFVPDR